MNIFENFKFILLLKLSWNKKNELLLLFNLFYIILKINVNYNFFLLFNENSIFMNKKS